MHIYICEVGSPDTSDSGLYYEVNCDDAGLHDLSWGWDSLECNFICNCLNLSEHEYTWGPDDKSMEVMQVQGHLKRHIDYWEQVLKSLEYIIEWLCATSIFCLNAICDPA